MLLALLPLLLACRAPGPAEARLELAPCHVTGLPVESRCGSWEVWEDRAARTGRRIALRVLVLPAVRPVAEPDPVFFLAGGPGQSAVSVAPQVVGLFSELRETRDLVFVDQRGTGGSNRLACEEPERPLAERMSAELVLDDVTRCRDALDADLRLYTTPIAMDDLDEVRDALGYARINLYGGSYGTRAGLVYLRQHPDRVRTLVLDGAAPPSMELFQHFAADAQAAWDAAARDCAADPACAGAHPTFGADLDAALAAFATPVEVEVTDPRTGAPQRAPVGREAVAGAVRAVLYAPELVSILPLSLAAARDGDPGPLFAQAATLGGASWPTWPLYGSIRPERELAAGMFLSVFCAEDAPRLTAEGLAAGAAGTFLGPGTGQRVLAACEAWPRGELPPGYHDPVTGDAPVLVLSGALDPVTPARWGEEVARHLPNAKHGVAPGAGHNVLPKGCAAELVAELVASGSTAGLDPSCLDDVRRPPFFVDLAGPPR